MNDFARWRVGLLLLAACGLRFWNLGGPGLWADEAYTAVISQQSLSGIRAALREDDAPALFYLLEKVFLSILGSSEWAVRVLPALCGCAAVFASYRLLRRFAPRAALIGLVVTGFASVAIFYSQQARSYSLLHLLTVLTIWALLRLRERPTPGRALLVSALCLGLLYSHNLGLWTVGTAGILALGWLRSARPAALAFLASLAIGAIPWGLDVLQQLGLHRGVNQWISHWWQTHSLSLAPLYSVAVFLNSGAGPVRPPVPLPILADSPNALLSIGAMLVPIAVALLGVIGLVRAFRIAPVPRPAATPSGNIPSLVRACRIAPGPRPDGRITPVLALFVLAPLAGLLLTHVVIGPSYVVGRTDAMGLFPFLLLLAFGWSRTHPALRTTALAIWVAACLLPLLPQVGRSALKGSDRALAEWLASRVEPGDAVVVPLVGRPTLEYYGDRQGWLERIESLSTFPPIGDLNPAAAFPTPIDSLDAYRAQARALRDSWERTGVTTVWCESILLETDPARPQRPSPPARDRARIDANRLAFPTSLLVYTLIGLEPAHVSAEFRRDWMGGDRVLLAIPRSSWVPLDSLSAEIEIQ